MDAPLAEEPWLVAAGTLATVVVVLALGWIAKKGLAQVTSEAGDSSNRSPQPRRSFR